MATNPHGIKPVQFNLHTLKLEVHPISNPEYRRVTATTPGGAIQILADYERADIADKLVECLTVELARHLESGILAVTGIWILGQYHNIARVASKALALR